MSCNEAYARVAEEYEAYQSPRGDELQHTFLSDTFARDGYQSPRGDELQRNARFLSTPLRGVVSVPAWG